MTETIDFNGYSCNNRGRKKLLVFRKHDFFLEFSFFFPISFPSFQDKMYVLICKMTQTVDFNEKSLFVHRSFMFVFTPFDTVRFTCFHASAAHRTKRGFITQSKINKQLKQYSYIILIKMTLDQRFLQNIAQYSSTIALD